MTRATIDFGIDLGTTNSAIAVLRGTVANIVKNNLDNDITPSAVFIDKRGQIQVGQRAKNRQEDDSSLADVHIEFKRQMGTDHRFEFKTSGRVMRPEQVSAEVLKSLREDVQQRLGEDMQSAVITIPAAFEAGQCAATKKAGEIAGFLQSPLLQEPVAAALSYGFQSDVTKEYWLIYDFGGGTFDAAIMKAEDGIITVVNHGGDNHLGGSDIDWAIMEKLVIPELTSGFNLPEFRRGNKQRWKTALAKLKNKIEAAKIQLSRSDTAYLEDCRFMDADGLDVEVEFKLTREALIRAAEPIIMRSVEICRRVLKEKNLSPNAIEKVILVGGPTLAPYFRNMLNSTLGIQLDHSVDPLTVVAKGAAVFAGTQRIEGSALPKASAGQFSIDLKYEPVGPDADPNLRGEVTSITGEVIEGYAVEFVNTKTHWRSGKIPLHADGKFKTGLMAERGGQNVFAIQLFDSKGSKQVVVPDTVAYTIGLTISERPINHPIAIALANNEVDVLFKKGELLPAKATGVYRSTHSVAKGSRDHILNIPVVEGELELADRNRLLGKLVIDGTRVRRDVPAGSEVEVTLHVDASQQIRVKAYVPMLDEEFEAVLELDESGPDEKVLRLEHEVEMKRLDALRSQANQAENSRGNMMLDEVGDLAEMESLVDAAKGDPDAAKKAEKQLLEVKVMLDGVESVLRWPALVAEASKTLADLDELIDQHGDADQKSRASKLRVQIDELVQQKRSEPLRKKIEQAGDLHREILMDQPGFWLGFFDHLIANSEKMLDQTSAERLINQGRQFINKGNVQGLRNVVAQLLGLMPSGEAEALQRGYQSGLLK